MKHCTLIASDKMRSPYCTRCLHMQCNNQCPNLLKQCTCNLMVTHSNVCARMWVCVMCMHTVYVSRVHVVCP